jgi:hypothetical protein
MIWLTDAKSQGKVALNTEHIVAIFKANDGEFANKTIVGLINGQIAVEEDDLTVVGMLQ